LYRGLQESLMITCSIWASASRAPKQLEKAWSSRNQVKNPAPADRQRFFSPRGDRAAFDTEEEIMRSHRAEGDARCR
jgi:hypothetical protein